MSVSWANAIAIHTRWRCPPDSSPTRLPTKLDTPASSIARSTACSSRSDHWRSGGWWGYLPRATSSSTRMSAGARDDCAKRPSLRASAFWFIVATARPSSSTTPPRTRKTRARARSRVDLPHALGPTITVSSPGSTSSERPSRIGSPFP